jgi:hypothetical protein
MSLSGRSKEGAEQAGSAIFGRAPDIGRVDDAEIGRACDLFAIKKTLNKLSQTLGIVDLLSTGTGQQTLLLEGLLEETRSTRIILTAIASRKKEDGEQPDLSES